VVTINSFQLQIDRLNVYYGGIHALRDVSMAINRGEFVAVIGANGAGKTTLLKSICGLKRASTGSILFQGQDISRLGPDRRVSLGISLCPEGRRVWPGMTVKENLMLGAYRRTRKEMWQDLERVWSFFPRLLERQKQFAGTLSGGEQQMLAIGRALMAAPRLLLLDEPSLGLAPVIVKNLAQIMKLINQQGTTILLAEQNASMALALADRVYVLETGVVVKEGLSADLKGDDSIRSAYLGRQPAVAARGV